MLRLSFSAAITFKSAVDETVVPFTVALTL